jgi:uncharacterized membrane protein YvbJ
MTETFNCPRCKNSNPLLATKCNSCGGIFTYADDIKPKETNLPKTKLKEDKFDESKSMNSFAVLCWIGCVFGCFIGAFILISGMYSAQSAPQEAVVCALACACAIVPYCLARAVTELTSGLKK